jgi:hypothetical protein
MMKDILWKEKQWQMWNEEVTKMKMSLVFATRSQEYKNDKALDNDVL